MGLWDVLGLNSTQNQHEKQEKDEQQVQELTISEIWVYPIKSCKGSKLDKAEYNDRGFVFDRHFLLVEEETNRFLTARELPSMVLITPIIDSKKRTMTVQVPLEEPEEYTIQLDNLPKDIFKTEVKVWAHSCDAFVLATCQESPDQSRISSDSNCGNSSGQDSVYSNPLAFALSKYLGKQVRLVMKDDESIRQSGNENQHDISLDYYEKGPNTGFADKYAFLFATNSSLNDLRQRISNPAKTQNIRGFDQGRWQNDQNNSSILSRFMGSSDGSGENKQPLEMVRFRPNVVIEGNCPAWDEDGWEVIQIMNEQNQNQAETTHLDMLDNMFWIVARCARCPLPNVDPQTGNPDKAVPQKILESYRRVDPKNKAASCFGVNGVPKSTHGTMAVGDKVRVVRRFMKLDDEENRKGVYWRVEDQ